MIYPCQTRSYAIDRVQKYLCFSLFWRRSLHFICEFYSEFSLHGKSCVIKYVTHILTIRDLKLTLYSTQTTYICSYFRKCSYVARPLTHQWHKMPMKFERQPFRQRLCWQISVYTREDRHMYKWTRILYIVPIEVIAQSYSINRPYTSRSVVSIGKKIALGTETSQ